MLSDQCDSIKLHSRHSFVRLFFEEHPNSDSVLWGDLAKLALAIRVDDQLRLLVELGECNLVHMDDTCRIVVVAQKHISFAFSGTHSLA